MKKRTMLLFPLLLILCCSMFVGANAFTVTTFNNSQVYNRRAAKEYVANHITKAQCDADPNYFYFVGADCTNFVSNVLRAGGITFKQGLPTYAHNWYYWGLNDRSGTWASAHLFRQHFGVVNDVGYKRSYQMRKYSPVEIMVKYPFSGVWLTNWNNFNDLFDNIGVGDVVQYTRVSNGQTYHSQIMQRKSQGEEGPNIKKLSMGQHSYDEWWNIRDYLRERCYTSDGTPTCWITVIRLNSSTPWTYN